MRMTRRTLMGASAAGVVLAAAGCNRGGGEQAAQLTAILDDAVKQYLHEIPEFATALGVSEEQAGGRYIDRLSDSSREGRDRINNIAINALAAMRRLNRQSLTGQDGVTYDVVDTALQDGVDAARFEVGGGATGPYAVTQLGGNYTFIPDFLASQHNVTDRDQADAYIARLRAYAGELDKESAMIAHDAGENVIPPDFAIDGAMRQLQTFANTAPAQTVLVAAFGQKLSEAESIAAADRTALSTQAETIVRDEVLPAYRRQIEALQAIRARATHDAGIWKLPQGAEMYPVALKSQTTTTMTADEIHEMGVDLVNSIQSEMDAILRAEGLTRGSVAERVQSLYTRPDQLYANTDAGREQCLSDLNAIVEQVRARMPEQFGTLARAALEIKRVPAYTEAGAPGGYYQVGALDGSRPGAYYINMRDMAELPKFTLPTLTFHEGVPGHHWQISIAQEAHGLPLIRSAILGFNAYQKGGRSIPSNWPTRWAIIATTRLAASAICNRRRSVRPASSSIPAFTRNAGRANRRSARWWMRPATRKARSSPRSSAIASRPDKPAATWSANKPCCVCVKARARRWASGLTPKASTTPC